MKKARQGTSEEVGGGQDSTILYHSPYLLTNIDLLARRRKQAKEQGITAIMYVFELRLDLAGAVTPEIARSRG